MRGSKRDTDVKNSPLDSVGEGEGRMIWEKGTEHSAFKYSPLDSLPGKWWPNTALGIFVSVSALFAHVALRRSSQPCHSTSSSLHVTF